MIKLPLGITIEKQPFELSCRRTINSLLNRILGLYEALYDRYGEDGLDLIRDVSTDYGRAIAERARGDGKPWDILKIGLFLVKVFNNVYGEGEVVDFNTDRVSIRVDRCVYPFRKVEICAAHTTMERTLVQGLNPAMDYVIEKSIPGGDECCLHVVKPRMLSRPV